MSFLLDKLACVAVVSFKSARRNEELLFFSLDLLFSDDLVEVVVAVCLSSLLSAPQARLLACSFLCSFSALRLERKRLLRRLVDQPAIQPTTQLAEVQLQHY